MSNQNKIKAIELTSIDSASFTGSYQVINTDGLDEPCSLIRIINDSNRDITVSYDGTTDHDFVPTAETLQLPAQANAGPTSWSSMMPKGTRVYVKGSAGTGFVYLAGYYAPRN